MFYTVSITRQGQISIPAKIRRKLGLQKEGKALVSIDERQRMVIEPVKDLLQLKGSLKATRKISPGKARTVFVDSLAARAK